ncbi:MAG: hypothetical protein MJ246_03340 [Clostridia bacterium]|nr:hypothetical protein [Clostridia bacterium]
MLSRLRNVHIHNFNSDKDHYPIRKTDGNIELYKDALRYLDQIGFNRAVVLEYAADYIEGETKEDILRNYIRLLYEYIEIHNCL